MATPRIFVSHSHADDAFGGRLIADLRRDLGSEEAVWYDVSGGLHGGDAWWRTIVAEIRARDIFLVVLSPDAVASKWVEDEIDLAWQLKNSPAGKTIVPILYRPCAVREDLLTRQVISFVAPKAYHTAYTELLTSLVMPRPAHPASAPSPAPPSAPAPSLAPAPAPSAALSPPPSPSRSPAPSAYRHPRASAPVHPYAPGTAPTASRSHSWRMPILIMCLLLLVAGSAAALYAATHGGAATPTATVTFYDAPGGELGNTTGAKVVAHGLSTPASGYGYFVWLIDTSTESVTPLGSLTGTNTTYTLTYTPPANLLGHGNLLEITVEPGNPVVPNGRVVLSCEFPLKTFVQGSLTRTNTTYTLTAQ
jgi:hypothetical protein